MVPYTVPRGGQHQVGGSRHSQTRDAGSSDVGRGWGTVATRGRRAVAGELSTGRRLRAAHPSMADRDSDEEPSSDFTPQPTGEDSSHVGEGGSSSDGTPQPTGEDINHASMDQLLAIIQAEVQAASSLPPAGSLPLLSGKAMLILVVCWRLQVTEHHCSVFFYYVKSARLIGMAGICAS